MTQPVFPFCWDIYFFYPVGNVVSNDRAEFEHHFTHCRDHRNHNKSRLAFCILKKKVLPSQCWISYEVCLYMKFHRQFLYHYPRNISLKVFITSRIVIIWCHYLQHIQRIVYLISKWVIGFNRRGFHCSYRADGLFISHQISFGFDLGIAYIADTLPTNIDCAVFVGDGEALCKCYDGVPIANIDRI